MITDEYEQLSPNQTRAQPFSLDPQKHYLVTALFFALTSVCLSWVGFDGMYNNPEGSTRIPGTLTQLWPVFAQLSLAIVLIASLARACKSARSLDRGVDWLAQHYRACLLALLALAAVGLAVGVVALRAFPNSGDEYGYLFEAATFRAGRLWNPLPPVQHAFTFFWIDEKDGKWVSQFFPGWPLILAAFTSLHLPGFVAAPVLGLLLLLVFSRVTYLVAGPTAALIGAALLSLCPFFLLNGASYFSHIPTALFAVLFVFSWVRYLEDGSIWSAALAGASLGAMGVIRPFTVFAVVLPAGIEFLRRAGLRHYLRLVALVIAGLPFLVGLLLYDMAITGNALLTPQAWTNPLLHVGLFPVDENGEMVSLLDTAGMALSRLFRLTEWTSPLLCLLFAAAFLWKLYRRRVAFYDFIFPLAVFEYLFFPDLGGNGYGPRYYFDAYPFLVLTTASAAALWFAEARDAKLKAGAAAAVAAAIVMGLGAFPALAYQMHRVVNQRMELFDLVASARLSNAVVIVGSPTGSAFPMQMTPQDLTRNGIDFSGSVIYALDVPNQLCAVSQAFPGRSFYKYEAVGHRYPGQLRPISPCLHAS